MPLIRSITKTLLVFCLLESAAFFLLFRIYRFPAVFLFAFLAVHILFHLVILIFLVINRTLFYNIKTGKAETFVNSANKITLFRITMLPFLLFLILTVQRYPAGPALVAVIALTFFSDFIDGRLARSKQLETYMGKILDSGSDYMLLGATAAAFFFFKILKAWLFWLIIFRLVIHSLGMLILFLVRKKLSPQTTAFGKTAIAAIMILFVVESAAILLHEPFWVRYVEIAAAVVIGLSVADKVIYFIRGLSESRA